jgi:hypothetical protein
MVQVPFEVQVVKYEPWLGGEIPFDRAGARSHIAHDVSDELRKHFARYPVPPDVRPLTAETSSAGDPQLVLTNGVRRALRVRHERPLADAVIGPELAWQVVIGVSLSAFLASLMTEAGKDAYLALKRLMHRLHAAAHHHGSTEPRFRRIELRDVDSSLIVAMRRDLPDRAYQQLLAIKLPPLPDGCSPNSLEWFGGRWVLQVAVPVPDDLKDDEAYWPQQPMVLVPLVWNSRDRRWKLPSEGRRGDDLFIE